MPALYVKSGTTLRDVPAGAGKHGSTDYETKRYHKPTDEYSEDWDVSGSIEDLRLLFEVGARVANDNDLAGLARGKRVRAGAREDREEPRAGERVSGSGRPAQRARQQPDRT